MSQSVALVAFLGFIICLLVRDVSRRPGVSAASWLVLIWAIIFATRPLSEWFHTEASVNSVDNYLEGSPIDRAVFLVLILMGYAVLIWRRPPLTALIRKNGALVAFYAFWAVSVFWSDYPFVAFKRWFKDFGAVVMIVVILTETEPVQAIKAVFVRAAYLLVPMSVLFVKFIPSIGRVYTGYGATDLTYVGVASGKNTLGALLLVCCVFLIWDLTSRKISEGRRGGRLAWLDSAIVLSMALWLLRMANSATALACTIVGVGVFLVTGVGFIRRRFRYIELYAIAGALVWYFLDSVFHVTEMVVLSLGRDMTLTTRTDAWQLFLNLGSNPLVGAGFMSFWAGDRMTRIWQEFPGIVQAHNGYIETYLEGGICGLLFLAIMMVAGFWNIKRRLLGGDDFARVRLTFWIVALFYNVSEAAFTQLSLLWIVTLLAVTEGTHPSVQHFAANALAERSNVAGRVESPWRPRSRKAALAGGQ